jgi:hypothetical protein
MSKTTLATVKVMLSYNYCHFEINKQIEGEDISNQDIDKARKDCQRLADKAVEQFKKAKAEETKRAHSIGERSDLEREVRAIQQKPEDTWTVLDKAKVKALQDYNHDTRYDYMDDDDYNIG